MPQLMQLERQRLCNCRDSGQAAQGRPKGQITPVYPAKTRMELYTPSMWLRS